MNEAPTCFEFYIEVNGNFCRYFVGPVYSPEGELRQISIRSDVPDATDGQKIGINIDPHMFKQFAMPNTETMSRIAIAQSEQECLFGTASVHAGHTLDFVIEPWEGDLTPAEGLAQDEMFIDLDVA